MRRLLLDAQLFHTPAWHRGMGKYSIELIKALAAQNAETASWRSIEIIISSQYEHEAEMLKAVRAIDGVTLNILDLSRNRAHDPLAVLEENRRMVDTFIAGLEEAPADIDYMILSLMQSEIAPAFPSHADIRKGVLFYDIIPLMFFETYLSSPIVQKEYLSKIGELVRADRYFAISKTVANDVSVYLGVDPARAITIDGGGISHSTKQKKFAVREPFILMPTGNDLRKNNRRGIEAFSMFNEQQDVPYKLVITSSFKPEEQAELQKLSEDVVFTGNIPGDELNYLYEHAAALLFPSEYEGLGMPIIEALAKKKPVACSDIAVFREISKSAFSYFDPLRVSDMAAALGRAVVSAPDAKESSRILEKYAWARTARLMRDAFAKFEPTPPVVTSHLVVHGPSPRSAGGLPRFMQLAHAELGRRFRHLEYRYDHAENGMPGRVDALRYGARVQPALAALDQKNVVRLYQLDNQPHSAPALFAALTLPGLVVLHDPELYKAWDEMIATGVISPERLALEKRIDEKVQVRGGIVSLVAAGHTVLCFDEKVRRRLSDAAAAAGVPDRTELIAMPSNDFAYHDITADRTLDLQAAELLGHDLEIENLMSRAAQVSTAKLSCAERVMTRAISLKYTCTEVSNYADFAAVISQRVAAMSKDGRS